MRKPGASSDRTQSELESRARAALVALEGEEPESTRNIRALGKDVTYKPTSITQEIAASLYESGRRPERRKLFVREAAKYLFGRPTTNEQELDSILANIGPRMRVMVDWMVSTWEEHYRPKTWMDSLNSEQQGKWASAKREYSRNIESLNDDLRRAREVYDKEVARVSLAQAVQRETLKKLLEDFGVEADAGLYIRPAEEGYNSLITELEAAGCSFRNQPNPTQC
jgi:hypothetical protein